MHLPDIKCGETGTVRVDLCDGDTITCTACDNEFTVADVEAVVAEWSKLLPWHRSHPVRAEERQAVAS